MKEFYFYFYFYVYFYFFKQIISKSTALSKKLQRPKKH
jgi:hypothetical protein